MKLDSWKLDRGVMTPILFFVGTIVAISIIEQLLVMLIAKGDIWEIRLAVEILLAVSIGAVIFRQNGIFISLIRNINARYGAKQRKNLEEKYQMLFEACHEAVYIVNRQREITALNKATLDLFGYSREEMMGLDVGVLYASQEERAMLLKLVRDKGYAENLEIRLKRKNGEIILCLLAAIPLTDEEGKFSGYQGIVHDITEQRKIQEDLRLLREDQHILQEQLYQSQKLEAMGQLAGGIAHDFNNILAVILGYVDLVLMTKMGMEEDVTEKLKQVRTSSLQAVALVKQLLAFSRKQMMEPKVINLNTTIGEMEDIIRRTIGEDIELEFLPNRETSFVLADPSQINNQVVMNLVVNARDAMPLGGRLKIEIKSIKIEKEAVWERPCLKTGRFVMISIEDTGAGIRNEVIPHIFEPFYTTKELGRGTGLGLSTVYGIVKQSDGFICVESKPGEGTKFEIYFPQVNSVSENETRDMIQFSQYPGGNETILFVEDDSQLRTLAKEVLVCLGYRFLEAGNGLEAIEVFNQNRDLIRLIISDVVMPKMSGRELFEKITPKNSGVKFLYISGYTDDAVVRHGVASLGVPFLYKPFRPETLAHKVREVLDS